MEKQEITIEKAMCNKQKCITIVKGLHLFVSGDPGFLFFGVFVCSLQSCLCSRPMIAVSSKSRGKESTDSGSQLNNLQLNSEIVGTSKVNCDLGDQKKEGKRSDFVEECPTIPNKNPKLLFNQWVKCKVIQSVLQLVFSETYYSCQMLKYYVFYVSGFPFSVFPQVVG
ncbi:uncharacterized protein [Pyrus communis]|uniref:uncharacterized protein isoform X2 n=1 Tax=Pyrus communis TaxID=23211 RepID=UPI0035C0AB1B